MAIVWGCDPDSLGFPIARYAGGRLVVLEVLSVVQFCEAVRLESSRPDLLVIEDVASQTFRYSRTDARFRGKTAEQKMAIAFKMGQGLGKCMQMQAVAMSIAADFGVPVIAVRPTRGNWANNKSLFESVTGWTGRSNADTRSAAFFGWMHRHYKPE